MTSHKEVKCVIWDLDNTVWDGVLLESDSVTLKPGIKEMISMLDKRGILHSIASKNDHVAAMEKLTHLGLEDYFLYPQINWNTKSHSVAEIQKSLNIGMDSLVFIDDQEFEMDEVKHVHPDIRCFNASEYQSLLDMPCFNPKFITEDSALRRKMYQDDVKRKIAESEYIGPGEDFLASLNMKFTIYPAKESDLQRAEELTIRTNQLNATGKTYNYDELNAYRLDARHKMLVCELEDKYGSYGKIGLALVSTEQTEWKIKMMLVSCRVVSRGVGTVLLNYIIKEAKKANKILLADFKDTGRNRMMYVNLRFAGFKELSRNEEGECVLMHDQAQTQDYPPYINIHIHG